MTFECAGDTLVGLLHPGRADATRAAVIVVGGPQYRVGSHRHFYLLAQSLAGRGVPVLRFDYRGMGDSDGAFRGFEHLDADIRAAIDALQTALPGVREVVVIGLCDAASAALMYAHTDARVTGIAIMNPWVRSEQSHARATVKHYYLQRIVSADMWRKVLTGGFEWRASLASFVALLRRMLPGGAARSDAAGAMPYQARMLRGFERFDGRTLLITSGEDLTAREFLDCAAASPEWDQALARPTVTRQQLDAANHTFSSAAWRQQVNEWIGDWVQAW